MPPAAVTNPCTRANSVTTLFPRATKSGVIRVAPGLPPSIGIAGAGGLIMRTIAATIVVLLLGSSVVVADQKGSSKKQAKHEQSTLREPDAATRVAVHVSWTPRDI